jgi:ATP-dependent DNA helicase RecQ
MLAQALRAVGVSARAYHAGLEQRGAVQDSFMRGDTRVIVATIAFGMGIDKSDIRFIVHFHPSRSLDAYYQEVGRAGRDGKLSQGVLFYSNNDWANLRRWAKSDEHKAEFLEAVYAAIGAQLGIITAAEGSAPAEAAPGAGVAGPVDARRLQQVTSADETAVRVAISLLERAELLSRGFDVAQELAILVPRRLPPAAEAHKGLLRLRKGLALEPGQAATFATADIARFMRWDLYDVETNLLKWQAEGWLTLRSGRRAMYVELPPRPPDASERLERLLSHARAVADRRIDDMIGYATSETCRHGYISAHFGSPPRVRCTVCDNCTGVRPDIQVPEHVAHLMPDDADIELMVLDCLASLPRPVGRSGLARILAGALRASFGPDKARHFGALKGLGEEAITEYIDDLLESERLRQYERQGFLVLAPTLRGRADAQAWLAEHPELNVYQEPLPKPEEEAAAEVETPEGDKYTQLQKSLWLWRRRMAEELGQPVYVIMSNEVMLRVAELRPQTLDELGALPGIGVQRLQHYGAAILDIVKLHPANSGDEALLATQRQALADAAQGGKATAGKIRETAATYSPQLERKILMRLQELRQKRAVAERAKPYSIAPDSLLRAIAQAAPTTTDDLYAITGFRSSGLAGEAEQIVAAIAALSG